MSSRIISTSRRNGTQLNSMRVGKAGPTSTMQNFTTRVGRRLRAVFRKQPRPSGPTDAKRLTELSRDVQKDLGVTFGSPALPEHFKHTDISCSSLLESSPSEVALSSTASTAARPGLDDDLGSGIEVECADANNTEDEIEADCKEPSVSLREDGDLLWAEGEYPLEDAALCDEEELNPEEKEQAVQLTNSEAQAIRDEVYVTFCGEDETDYTEGPARVVLANDGVRDCSALLMTLELSQAMQKAIVAERAYNKAQAVALHREEVLMRFTFTLDAQIASHKSRLSTLSVYKDEEQSESHDIEKELSVLELMLDENKLERTAVHNNLEFQADMLRRIQAKANALLEDALTSALLLQPEPKAPELPQEDLDLEAEYQTFHQKLKEANGVAGSSVAPLDTSNQHMIVAKPMTDEELQIERLQRAVWDARLRLISAQGAFDRREAERQDAEQDAIEEAAARGGQITEDGQAEFDLRWLRHEQELTRELINAEAAFESSKKAAIDGGADIAFATGEQTSTFQDDSSDGYRLSQEQELIASISSDSIERWLAGMPESLVTSDVCNSFEVTDIDEWEAEGLDVGDSYSGIIDNVAGGSRRTEIDSWRETAISRWNAAPLMLE